MSDFQEHYGLIRINNHPLMSEQKAIMISWYTRKLPHLIAKNFSNLWTSEIIMQCCVLIDITDLISFLFKRSIESLAINKQCIFCCILHVGLCWLHQSQTILKTSEIVWNNLTNSLYVQIYQKYSYTSICSKSCSKSCHNVSLLSTHIFHLCDFYVHTKCHIDIVW